MLSRTRLLDYALALALIFIISGCSGSGGNPITPGSPVPDQGLTGSTPQDMPDADRSADGGFRALWALYDITIDSDTLAVEITPIRHEAFTFNVTRFLQPPAGDASNLGIALVDTSQFQSAGRIDLDISFTHPFPSLPKTRGFDVMGVFMSDGSIEGEQDPSVLYPEGNAEEARLLNADGYTRWMNATEFTDPGLLGFTPGVKGIYGFLPTSTINGFKYYTENLDVTTDLPAFFQTSSNISSRGSFKAGTTLTRRYEIQFPMSGGKPYVRYQYAILASWAQPDPAGGSNPAVSHFPPEANLQEAIHLSVADNGSNLFFETHSSAGGILKLRIEIFDWQGSDNPGGVAAELYKLWIEDAGGHVVPGGAYDMLPGAIVTDGLGNSSVFTVELNGCTPQYAGLQEFLITAVSKSPTNYDNGFGSTYPEGVRLAAYNLFSVPVSDMNPCPTPTITAPSISQKYIYNRGDVVTGMPIVGTNFMGGPDLAAELYGPHGFVFGRNVQVTSPTTAIADFDFSTTTAGQFDFLFRNGCGVPSQLKADAIEINTPPRSAGITGPISGQGNAGVVIYNANASDPDTDPVDTLSYTWNVWHTPSNDRVLGPTGGDPFSFDYGVLSVGQFDVNCVVSDGHPPADIDLHLAITRDNTQPNIGPTTGPTPVWRTDIFTYSVVASDIDPGQSLTYLWSLVPQGNPPAFTLPGDPTPGDITINWQTFVPSSGRYDLSCQVNDNSGALNQTAASTPLGVSVADPPYMGQIPTAMFNQVITPGTASLQGIVGCTSFQESFYAPLGGAPIAHPDVSILSGPSLGVPGTMLIADEVGLIVGLIPVGSMGFAQFQCPFMQGGIPSSSWTTTGLWPGGPDMIPGAIHFDGNSMGEIFVTNNQMTNKLAGFGVPDPAVFQHYVVGGAPPMNDLFTSLAGLGSFDVAVDTSAGFDMGSTGSPMMAPLYGLYTQDLSGILASCGGPAIGAIAPNPVNILQFPASGVQPVGTAVDAMGSVGVVAPMPVLITGVGPGLFNDIPGGPCPAGALVFPEPYYALGIDDDPADNLYSSGLPQPVINWVLAATIDADRDLEVYEIDFGVPPPGPAMLMPYSTMPMGNFLGGNPNAYPLDCEFISNFSGFPGAQKPVWPEDLLAVLLTDPIGGFVTVEIYSITPGAPTLISSTLPIPTPGAINGVPGVGWRLDVDEVTGDIYVLHEDTVGLNMTVTMIPY